MGMSASQARFLSLTARKNNVEFEGQQINQQRTTLSNQSANYYSELCNMVVPTPPSVDDYTKVSYTFDDGALTNTITSMIAKGNGMYSISFIQQWQDDYSIVSASSSLISKTDAGEYKVGTTTLRTLGTVAGQTIDQIQAMTDEEFETFKTKNLSDDKYLNTLDKSQLEDLMAQEKYYQSMLNENVLGNPASTNAWFVRYVKNSSTGSYVPYFYQEKEVKDDTKYSKDGFATSNINCYSVGSSTKNKEMLNQLGKVEKDSSGRYISITLYQTDKDGNIVKDPDTGVAISTTYSLTTNTSTDEEAYNDAMNQYNYDQQIYDKRIQDINSRLKIVQQQDKALELNLKQLDTEENAISNEMDAVKKVIAKNVESSFKTFNA